MASKKKVTPEARLVNALAKRRGVDVTRVVGPTLEQMSQVIGRAEAPKRVTLPETIKMLDEVTNVVAGLSQNLLQNLTGEAGDGHASTAETTGLLGVLEGILHRARYAAANLERLHRCTT